MQIKSLAQINCKDARVLLRLDLNVPIVDDVIVDDQRIQRSLATIRHILAQHGRLIIVSHLGRPTTEQPNSLIIVARHLSQLLGRDVPLTVDWQARPPQLQPGEVTLLENIRQHPGECQNDPSFARELAALADIFVMDAFASCHRLHASTVGIIPWMRQVAIGFLLQDELQHLHQAFAAAKKPLAAIIGGAKIATKLKMLAALMSKVDYLMIGGAMAHTLLLAGGYSIGRSMHEPDLVAEAKNLLQMQNKCQLLLPIDVVVTTEFSASAPTFSKDLIEIASDEIIVDIGEKTRKQWSDIITHAQTVIWNGPVGLFEWQSASAGTKAIIAALTANSEAFRIAGGGDTLSALKQLESSSSTAAVSYASTGGGAFLSWLENANLPVLSQLAEHVNHDHSP